MKNATPRYRARTNSTPEKISRKDVIDSEAMIGSIVAGKYQIIRLIGEGGMGAVFEAEHGLLGHRVAIKMMHRNLVSSDEAFARFLREAQACGSLNHPNIVAVRDFDVDKTDNIFMVMELLRGETLADLLERRGMLPLERSVSIALQVLSGLHMAHAAGVVHRDLKPENIFLSIDPRGREKVKILDFGVAKIQADEKQHMRLTRTGAVIGTPSYLSPEQARARRDIDGRADLWSVGVVLYEMLTGERPFDGRSYNETFSRILLEEPTRLVDLVPHVPRAVAEVVERALRKEPEERFPSASRMLDELFAALPHDESMMSKDAFIALRGSSEIPLPPTMDEKMPTRQTPVEPRLRVRSNPTRMEVTASDISQLGARKFQNRGRMWLAGIVAATGISFVTTMALWRDEALEPTQVVPAESLSSDQTPLVEWAAPSPVEEEPYSMPKSIELTVEGIPNGARAQLDGRPIVLPYRQEASSEPRILQVLADGREPFEVALVLDRTLSIEYTAAPRSKPRRTNFRPKNRPKKIFLENPF